MLTEEQVIAILSHNGDRGAMLNAAYHMGMMRAAEVCEDMRHIRLGPRKCRIANKRDCAAAIRAEAGSGTKPSMWYPRYVGPLAIQ